MGNQISNLFNSDADDADDTTKLKPASVKQIIDYIATYYILTMDFQSLRKLYDIEYCDKLVILTSDIIERYFTDIQITYLAENIKNGQNEVGQNEVGQNEVRQNEMEKDKMIFFNKDDISKLDIRNPVKKRRVCIGIAKYYIKIAHVFATILTTINPIYVYKDENGNKVNADIYNRSKIPKDAEVEILKFNICDNRIDALKRDANIDFSKDQENDTEIKIHPKMCSFNLKPKDGDNDDDTKNLEDEPGIPELMELYYDDEYDYETGKFRGMKKETQELFNTNLENFYNVFMETEGKPIPDNIKKFSDIKLKNYNKKEKCQGKYPAYDSSVRGTLNDDLFKQYAENLKQMLNKANVNQELLLDVLNKLFVYMTDPQTKKKIIRINPELTEELLHETVLETRAIIINLYLTCETDFANGIKIYEAIVDKKIIDTAKSQIETMEKTKETLITEDEIPKPAELKELKAIADRKIQRQKEELAVKEVKIQKEQEKIDLNVKPIVEELKAKEEELKEAKEAKEAKEEVKVEEAKEADLKAKEEEVVVQQPMVKVKINVQGQGPDEVVKETLVPETLVPVQVLGGNTSRKNKKIRNKKSTKKNK
jgi:hypothetical protein